MENTKIFQNILFVLHQFYLKLTSLSAAKRPKNTPDSSRRIPGLSRNFFPQFFSRVSSYSQSYSHYPQVSEAGHFDSLSHSLKTEYFSGGHFCWIIPPGKSGKLPVATGPKVPAARVLRDGKFCGSIQKLHPCSVLGWIT